MIRQALKGNPLHEVVHLPKYWQQIRQVDFPLWRLDRLVYGQQQRQYVLAIQPLTEPKAWIYYWHGGGWTFGKPEAFLAAASPWIEQGYGVFMPSYRRLPLAKFSGVEADLVAGIQVTRDWIAQQQLPSGPVAFVGMSAGGHLASLAALNQDLQSRSGLADESVLGAIICGGVLDLKTMPSQFMLRQLTGRSSGRDLRQFNPVDFLFSDAPRFLVIHGTSDGLVPFRVATSFVEQYQRVTGESCLLEIIPQGTHLDAGRWIYQDGLIRRRLMDTMEMWRTEHSI